MGDPEDNVFEVAYETTFCATHVLHEKGEPIEPQHGHDWRVEVVAAGDTLDTLGTVRRILERFEPPGFTAALWRAAAAEWTVAVSSPSACSALAR